MNPKVECCSVWGMLLNVTPSNHTHYHPCHFVSFKFKVWLLSNTINMPNTVVYWVCNWHCAGQSALEIFIFFNFCRFWQRNLLDSCKYWRTMHIPSTSPSSLWYECPPPSRNHCQQFRDALSFYVPTHHTTSSSIYLPLYQGHLTPAVVQTRDGLSTRLHEPTITTTPLSLSITLLQTRNGYDIWLQAEKQRVRSLIDKFWHFSLPRPQLWRHYNPTDYHRAYTILLQKIIWYDWWKVGWLSRCVGGEGVWVLGVCGCECGWCVCAGGNVLDGGVS